MHSTQHQNNDMSSASSQEPKDNLILLEAELEQSSCPELGERQKNIIENLCDLLTAKNSKQLEILLEQLAAGLQVDNARMQLKAACYLTDTLELLIAHQEWQCIEKLLPALERAVAVAGENDIGVWQLITALSAFAAYQIEMGKYTLARHALLILTHSNALAQATEEVRQQTAQLINDMATQPLLELLLVEYLYDKDKGHEAGRLLAVFGRTAAEFLVKPKNIKQGLEKTDQILRLFEHIGPAAEASLCTLIQQTQDWYLIRNIIRLLGETGSPASFNTIAAFLGHEDLRVQGEVLRAASRIEAGGKKDFFLKALKAVPRQLTELVVSLLGDIPDSSLVVPLADLLDETALIKNKASQSLQMAICQTLGKIGSVKAIPTLKKIIAANTVPEGANTLNEQQVVRAAEQAIQLINHGGKHKRNQSAGNITVSSQNNPYAARESGILRTALAGERSKAARQLFDLIVECVHNKDLLHAERLKERFNEINPNAIAEIIQSEEMIEQAKSGVTVRGYLEVWSNLLHELSAEEFSAIYHELENRTLEPEELLVEQGAKNDELFFINSGTLRIFYKKNDRKVYIKSLGDGDLAGENFFDSSVWTVSISALTESRISILRRSCFSRWQEAFPGLEVKLRDFYNSSNNIRDMLKRKGLNRRSFERFSLSRKIEFSITDHSGSSGQRFKGRLSDVSRGGLALHFRIAQQKDVRVLLGRKMHIVIPVVGIPPILEVYGQVLSVNPVAGNSNENKIHLVFDEPLPQETLQVVLG
jgi:HEAT repeat protein/CRP-like cAMP-binding protein